MSQIEEAIKRLTQIPELQISLDEPLALHTRFGIGGPARVLAQTARESSFVEAAGVLAASGGKWLVMGGGTNLVVSDAGFPGVVLKFTGERIEVKGTSITVEAGASLQRLVDISVEHGLAGLHRMTGIPGQVGAAVYGNAGAYGSSVSDFITEVRYFDGEKVVSASNAECGFRYRESRFKRDKRLLILSAALRFGHGDSADLARQAADILSTRNAKYPTEMRCAGSIFKNLIHAALPEGVRRQVPQEIVKGGKVPSAWFLEQTGVKGMRSGGIRVADYHANLIYNDGGATAAQLRTVIGELKRRVRERFAIELEEEVQFVGFDSALPGVDSLSSALRVIDGLIEGASEEEMSWRPSEARWSVGEVLMHLAHVERECFLPRLKAFAHQPEPVFERYDPGDFQMNELGWSDWRTAMQDLRLLRDESLDLLSRLDVEAGERMAQHLELGQISLNQLLSEWAFHDLGHIRQIAELIRAKRYYPEMGPFRSLYKVNP